ncbi:tetratricopeptide repeat protein [Alloacidobacterium sp.]|uniref:tetratricopeptide repeat protein n=1 Tax=Alloacidobacterium sp. TaxID=2951999 RepID=UPI002D6C7924|nr:tetratricopeptide repeat protein [Alloacidobacterium sp.]HYK37298.1 tetratricopeptide repeat protein [Alloacidobacterium sp.]
MGYLSLFVLSAGLAMLFLTAEGSLAQNSPGDFNQVASAASAAREQQDIPRAIELYQRAVRLHGDWAEGWWYLGTLRYGVNNYTSAVEALSHYIELTPNAGPAYALRGLCEFELGSYQESLHDLQHGISLGAANNPRNAGIISYHEAILLTKLDRFEEALAKYSVIVKHGNVNTDVTNGIGLAVLRMPMFPSDIHPSQQGLVLAAGQAAAKVMSGDMPGAARAFTDLFERYPNTPNLHYSYGYLLSSVDQEQAILQLRKELDISPSSAIVHSMLAWALGMQGEFAAALPNAQKAAEEEPSLPMAQLALGKDLIETGDIQGGLPHIEAVLKGDPNNLEAHLALAKAYSKLGQRDDARRERLLCLKLSGQGTAANENL